MSECYTKQYDCIFIPKFAIIPIRMCVRFMFQNEVSLRYLAFYKSCCDSGCLIIFITGSCIVHTLS